MQYKRLIGTLLLALLLIAPYVNWRYYARVYGTGQVVDARASAREVLGRLRVVRDPDGFLIPSPPGLGLVKSLVEHGYEPYPLASIIVFRKLPGEVSKGILTGECCRGWGSDPRLSILMVNAYYLRAYGEPLRTSTPLLLVVYPNDSVKVVPAGNDSYGVIASLMDRLKTWYANSGGVLVILNPASTRFTDDALLELGSDEQWRLLRGRGNGRVLVLLLAGDYDSVDLRVYQALLGFPVSRSRADEVTGVLFHKGSMVVVDGGSGLIEALGTYG